MVKSRFFLNPFMRWGAMTCPAVYPGYPINYTLGVTSILTRLWNSNQSNYSIFYLKKTHIDFYSSTRNTHSYPLRRHAVISAPLARVQKARMSIRANIRCHHTLELPHRRMIAAMNTASSAGLCATVLTIDCRKPRINILTLMFSSSA